MNNKHFWQKIIALLCVMALCLSGTSIVSAAEEGADIATEPPKEEERLEPDAYFEPVQTNDIPDWPAGPAVWAESAVVMDIDSGTFLYSKNMDAVKYPASITKIMTSLIAIENSRLDERVTFSEHAIFGIERNSSHIGIRVGEILSMEECLYGMMLESANEVCLAVAEHIGGSVEGFVAMMNQKAAELGCTNTNFTNPNGLPDENHYTTAHDMALIAKAAYNNRTFRKVCRTQITHIPTTNVCGEERWLNNHHKMLPDRDYSYEGCTGGKTGFTQAALNTLVTYAERGGRRLVCVSLRTNGPQVYRDTATLLDYGFNNFQNITLYSRKSSVGTPMLFPSLYFGQPATIDALRPSCTVTIPITAVQEQLETVPSVNEGTISRDYFFNQYPVGKESVPDTAIRTLMTPGTDGISIQEDTGFSLPLPENIPAVDKTMKAVKEIPLYIYLLILLLIVLIIMEIVLGVRRKRRKKRLARKKKYAKHHSKK